MVMVSKYAVFCPPRPSRPAGAGLGTYPSKRFSFTWESGTHSTNWYGPVEMLAVLLTSFAASSAGMMVVGEAGDASRSMKAVSICFIRITTT